MPAHTATSSDPDSIYFDRFGNSYDIDFASENHSPENACDAGYFRLIFDITDTDLEPVFCKVFEDLSSLVARRDDQDGCELAVSNGTVNITVSDYAAGSSAVIMSGSASHQVYPSTQGHNCYGEMLVSNRVELKMKGGRISEPFIPDGIISVNTDFTGEYYYDWTTTPSTGKYDAYSVILHEALHVLGFESSMEPDGTAGSDGFYLWDYFLHTTPAYNPSGPSSDVEPLIISDCDINCWSLNTNVFADEDEMIESLINQCGSGDFDFVFGENAVAPIAGRNNNVAPADQAELKNLLSHLNPTCNSQNIQYVMQPGISSGASSARRVLTSAEEEILCQLGYIVDACDECYLIANPEFFSPYESLTSCCDVLYSGCLGSNEILLEDLLCNDFNSDEVEITDAWGSGFSVTLGASSITFSATTTGVMWLNYTVKSCNCLLLNATAEINIGPCTDCEEIDPCENLVCVEDFEEYDPGVEVNAVQVETAGHFWYTINGDNTLDICEDGVGNNVLMIASHPNNREGLAMKLSEPLSPGCTIHVSFDASSGLPNNFVWYVSEYPPCPSSVAPVNYDGQATDCGTYVFSPIRIQTVPVQQAGAATSYLCTDTPDLLNYEFSWTNASLGFDINYLILFPDASVVDARNYIDNIVVTKSCIDAEFDIEIVDECLEIEFTSHDENIANDHDWDFGDLGTSTSIDPTHVYSSSGSFTVTHTVTDECGNSETVSHEVETGVCCDDFTVTTNTNWATTGALPNSGVFHTLTVQQGVTLRIAAGVVLKFCQGGSLVVEHGAYVQTRGTFTSVGNLDWQGVFVQGEPTASQYPNCGTYSASVNCQPQGFFFADADALIENAEIGVRNYGPEVNTTGGMIKAEGATFKNNGKGVEFREYRNFLPANNQPRASLGVFTECEFINTSGASGYSIAIPFTDFVKLDGVDGIRFWGCTFNNDLDVGLSSGYEDFGDGIRATGSEFKVQAKSTIGGPGPCLDPCVVTTPTTFNGLACGILIDNKKGIRPYTITQCVFQDCYVGIQSESAPGGTVLFNEFSMGNVPLYYHSNDGQMGVYFLADHPGFEFQENTFSNDQEGNTETIGVTCNGIGGTFNFIRRNKFYDLLNAHQAMGPNATEGDLVIGGLIYLCDSIQGTPEDGFDIFVSNQLAVYDAIYINQGMLLMNDPYLLPAANNFSHTVGGHDIVNQGDLEFAYFWYDQGEQEPDKVSMVNIGYTASELFDSNPCTQDFCAPPCLDDEDIADLKTSYPELYSSFEGAVDLYWEAIEEEDSTEAEEQRRISAYYASQFFDVAYKVLAHTWIDTVNFHIDTLLKWYRNMDTYAGDVLAAREIAGDGRMSEALDSLEILPLRRNLTSAQEVDLSRIITVYSIIDTTEIANLSLSEKSIIRNIALSEVGISSCIARAILRDHGERYPVPYFLGRLNEPPVKYRSSLPIDSSTVHSKVELAIEPVPASDWLRLEYRVPYTNTREAMVEIYDVSGQAILRFRIEPNQPVNLNVSEWHAGIYFVALNNNSGLRQSKIIYVNK